MEITGISADEALLIDAALSHYIKTEAANEPERRLRQFRAIRRRVVLLTPESHETMDKPSPRVWP